MSKIAKIDQFSGVPRDYLIQLSDAATKLSDAVTIAERLLDSFLENPPEENEVNALRDLLKDANSGIWALL